MELKSLIFVPERAVWYLCWDTFWNKIQNYFLSTVVSMFGLILISCWSTMHCLCFSSPGAMLCSCSDHADCTWETGMLLRGSAHIRPGAWNTQPGLAELLLCFLIAAYFQDTLVFLHACLEKVRRRIEREVDWWNMAAKIVILLWKGREQRESRKE